jgi:serine kinase of HPr protein (carbohydrate metabolism regulator)
MTDPATVHASAVLLGERGVLIRGAAGSGKSSLLLGLLADAAASTWLIADDRVILTPANGRLVAAVPPMLAGLLEIRGQGIVRRPFVSPARLHLVVDLLPRSDCDRMPMPQAETVSIASIELPLLRLPIGIADGPVRVRAALARQAFGSQPLKFSV